MAIARFTRSLASTSTSLRSVRHLNVSAKASSSGSSTATSAAQPTGATLLPATSLRPVFFKQVQVKDDQTGAAFDVIPAFRVLDGEGKPLADVPEEWKRRVDEIDDDTLVRLYRTMSTLPQLDAILSSSQRQGRISFYMTSLGEEGTVVGSAAAFEPDDEVFAQYREVGVLLWRGYPFSSLMSQVFSTASDKATSGRQMPVHYGSKELHFHTISSPLATQIPQAAGAAYALKRTPGREKGAVVCYFGEGASSEGDFHAGLNMASVLGGPLVFIVRNNGFAISTPATEQYHGDGIASRGPGYGMETVRVDGNDPLAVLVACKEARRRAVESQKPVLVEAMSYRVGHHSTSDDSSAYRSAASVESIKKFDSPLFRLRRYLESRSPSLWSDAKEDEMKATTRKEILKAFSAAEREKKPAIDSMWHDTFADMERPQREQRAEMRRVLEKYSKFYEKEFEKHEGGKEAFFKAVGSS